MNELIVAIAALCQIHSGTSTAGNVEERQAICHAYYAKCLIKAKTYNEQLSCLERRSK